MNLAVIATLPDVFRGRQKLVVIAPHPDDETLGCGALLAQAFAQAGAHVICMTDGGASHPGSMRWPAERLARLRQAELVDAVVALGGAPSDLTWLGLPDGSLSRSDKVQVADRLMRTILETGAQHVFAPALEDHHADHKATHRIVREVQAQRADWTFWTYPVWSRWDDPNFVDSIARHRPVCIKAPHAASMKRAAINAHQSQLGKVVRDDPGGFSLPLGMVEKFVTEDEVFWRMD